jgi:hypothetical protein
MRSPFAENPISEFDKLVAELAGIRRRQKWAGELTARARGDGSRGQFRKALSDLDDMYKTLPPKRRTVILKGAPEPIAGAEVIAKAFHALKHGDLNADQKGRLMLALGNLAEGVAARQATFSKALPTATQLADPNVRRRTAAQVAADLEKRTRAQGRRGALSYEGRHRFDRRSAAHARVRRHVDVGPRCFEPEAR